MVHPEHAYATLPAMVRTVRFEALAFGAVTHAAIMLGLDAVSHARWNAIFKTIELGFRIHCYEFGKVGSKSGTYAPRLQVCNEGQRPSRKPYERCQYAESRGLEFRSVDEVRQEAPYNRKRDGDTRKPVERDPTTPKALVTSAADARNNVRHHPEALRPFARRLFLKPSAIECNNLSGLGNAQPWTSGNYK